MKATLESGVGEPPSLVRVGQRVHHDLKAVLALGGLAGRQQILHQLEHADDVPPLLGSLLRGRQILRQQENYCCEQSLSGVVEKCVLPVV